MSSQNSKLMPNLDEKSTKQLNLTVLQRIDPFVEEILITAAHVTLYGFDIDTSQWSRKDVEGSLFVVKRNTQPRFQFIVMNRRNTDNMVEDLLGDFEYEVQVPYLLYRNATQEVSGIWFYNARECEEVANLFGRILNAYSKVPSKTKASSSKSEFEELEAVSSSTVMDDALESPPSTTTSVKDIPDDRSFVNFFSTPMHSGKSSSSSTLPGVTTHPQVSASPSSEFAPTPFILPCSKTEPSNISSRSSTDLVKPSSFFGQPLSSSPPLMMPPVASSVPTAPPLYPLQRHDHGAPLLQPFPPPTPPSSLTPASVPASDYRVVISREKVGEALQMLVQDNQFIDMVYQKLLNAHQS